MSGEAVALAVAGGGVQLRLRAKPGGRRNRLLGAHGGALKLEVTAAPERGKANTAIVKLLAAELGLARSQLAVIAGATSQDKRLEITGITVEDLARRLARLGILAEVDGPK